MLKEHIIYKIVFNKNCYFFDQSKILCIIVPATKRTNAKTNITCIQQRWKFIWHHMEIKSCKCRCHDVIHHTLFSSLDGSQIRISLELLTALFKLLAGPCVSCKLENVRILENVWVMYAQILYFREYWMQCQPKSLVVHFP